MVRRISTRLYIHSRACSVAADTQFSAFTKAVKVYRNRKVAQVQELGAEIGRTF